MFWSATQYEFETQLQEAIAMASPPKAKPVPVAQLRDFLMSKVK